MLPQNLGVKSRMVFFIEQQTFCDDAVTDQPFDFHTVKVTSYQVVVQKIAFTVAMTQITLLATNELVTKISSKQLKQTLFQRLVLSYKDGSLGSQNAITLYTVYTISPEGGPV